MKIKRCSLLDFGVLLGIVGDSFDSKDILALKAKLKSPWIHIVVDEDSRGMFITLEFLNEYMCNVHIHSNKNKISFKELLKFIELTKIYASNAGCRVAVGSTDKPEIKRLYSMVGFIKTYTTKNNETVFIREE